MMPVPENPPLQMLLIEKATAATESGTRSTRQKADLTRLKTEMTKAGVLVSTLALQPSAQSKRLSSPTTSCAPPTARSPNRRS